MMARMSSVAEQKTASEALVLPVEAQAARLAPTMRAWVNAAVMPLSLKLPEGFMPSYCKNKQPAFMPANCATASARCRIVCPSPIVMILSAGANGNSSRKRQTPLKKRGLDRLAHLASNQASVLGGCC